AARGGERPGGGAHGDPPGEPAARETVQAADAAAPTGQRPAGEVREASGHQAGASASGQEVAAARRGASPGGGAHGDPPGEPAARETVQAAELPGAAEPPAPGPPAGTADSRATAAKLGREAEAEDLRLTPLPQTAAMGRGGEGAAEGQAQTARRSPSSAPGGVSAPEHPADP